MKIFYTTKNGGDGSSSVVFFDSQECIDYIEERDPETFGAGEGGHSFEADNVTGIRIWTLEEVQSRAAAPWSYLP